MKKRPALQKGVRQEDSMGCGVACVAFVLGKSYRGVKLNLIKNRQKALKQGYLCKELVDSLKRGGLTYAYRYLKHVSKYKDSTIVFIKRNRRFPRGHYVVKTERGWMDPWINMDLNIDVRRSIAGFRKRLPSKASYALVPTGFMNRKQR